MMEMGILLAFALGMIGLYCLAWVLLVPMRFVVRLLLNSALGGLAILILNLVGGLFGIHLSLNFLTAVLVGLLGIPGVILCLVLF